MNKRTNILLTGASGAVGYEVLKQLYKQKSQYNITVFDIRNRHSEKRFKHYKKEIEIIYGDISDKERVKLVCSGKDVVIHLAAVIPPVADNYPDLAWRVNYGGTRNLIDALSEISPQAFFLYASSISVYGDRLTNPYIRVNDPLIPAEGDEYAKTKIKAEEYLQNSSLDWSIFRLTAIMGNHKMSKLMFHQPLKTSMEIATPADAARAFVKAIHHRKVLSQQIFNLSGGSTCRITYEDFLKRSFSIFGLGKPDFPPKSFAEKNFHCGYYADGDVLEDILHFRRDNLETFFYKERQKVSAFRKMITFTFQKFIKKHLLKLSEPYRAFVSNDEQLIHHFF